jgi:hypothetical protein
MSKKKKKEESKHLNVHVAFLFSRYLSTDYFGVLIVIFMTDWLIEGQERTLKASTGEIIKVMLLLRCFIE